MKRLLSTTGIAAVILPMLMIVLLFTAIPAQQTGTVTPAATTTDARCDDDADDDPDTTGGAAMNTVEAWTKRFGDIAFKTGKKYGIPYEAILGQSAVESAWGASAPNHNYFGIKGTGGATTGTTECGADGCYATTATWAAFKSDADGFDGYGRLITTSGYYDKALDHPGDPYEYLKAIKAAGYATAPDYVSVVWSVTRSFIEYIKANDLYPPSSEVTPDRKPSDTDGGDRDSDSSTTAVSCTDTGSSSASNAVVGKVGGAPDGGDKGTRDFGWLCSTDAKVCSDGDFGPFPSFAGGGRYQCYWYALVRLWVIHHHDVSNWGTMFAAQIPGKLASDPDYTVDSTPHPGDGVAQTSGALGGLAPAGHVAVVEEVEKDADGWRIRISEGNFGTDGSGPWDGYNTRWLTEAQFKGAGNVFFRKNSWKN